MPREVFVAGQILTAAEMNVVSDQTVMSFAGTAARGSAIPSPTEGMVSYLNDSNSLEVYTTSWGPINRGFTASSTITATNASWPVPSLASPIVKVTVSGGGGGGGGGDLSTGAGGNGGITTFNAGGAGTVTAAGGFGGAGGSSTHTGGSGNAGFGGGNGGRAGGANSRTGSNGLGGEVTVAYLNLTGISTVNVTIGAGGTAGGGGQPGGVGGAGRVVFEYVAD